MTVDDKKRTYALHPDVCWKRTADVKKNVLGLSTALQGDYQHGGADQGSVQMMQLKQKQQQQQR